MTRHWAFSSDSEKVVKGFDADGRIVLDDGPYRGFLEHKPVRPGVSMFRAQGSAGHAYSLRALGEVPSDNLVLGCLLGGSGTVEAEGNDDLIWREAEHLYAVSLSRRQVVYHLQPDRPFHSLALMITPEALDLLARDHDLPDLARNVLRNQAAPVSTMRPLAAPARRLARDLLEGAYHGRMAQLHREARTLELLALQLDALGDAADRATGSLTSRDVMRVREARERLLADLQNPPDLAGLASSVNLTPKRLNQGFRALFGTTAFDYLAEARLQMARTMLDQGLDLPLKTLAWQLGYNQASNFINAFRRRFGVSPGAYRRHER